MNTEDIKKTLSQYYKNTSISESLSGADFISYDLYSNGVVLFGLDCTEDDKNLLDFWTKKDLFELTEKVTLDFEEDLLTKYAKIKNVFNQKNIKIQEEAKTKLNDFINEDYYDRPYYLYSLTIKNPTETPIIYITVCFEMTEKYIKPIFYITFGDIRNNDYFYIDFNDDDKLIETIDNYLTKNIDLFN